MVHELLCRTPFKGWLVPALIDAMSMRTAIGHRVQPPKVASSWSRTSKVLLFRPLPRKRLEKSPRLAKRRAERKSGPQPFNRKHFHGFGQEEPGVALLEFG